MDAPPSRRSTRSGLALGLAVAAVLMVLDQVTKAYVEAVLAPGEFVPWLSDAIGWQLVYNDGAAFGLPLPSWVFPVVTLIVAVVVVRALPQLDRRLPVVGYGMLLAGAFGNVVDRVLRAGDVGDPRWLHGHVVDFIAWGAFPRFNIADSAITVGLTMLVIDMLWGSDHEHRAVHEPMMMDLGGQGHGSPTVRVLPPDGADPGDSTDSDVFESADDDVSSSTP